VSESSSVYNGRSGQWAFMVHRITGFLVVMFLLLHVVDVSLINIDREMYDDVHELYGNVFLRIFEVGLLGALLFHALNGLRIIAYDFFPGAVKHQKEMLTAVVFLTVLLTIVGGFIILAPAFEGN
jgi:succinate dehydrogenase / fumarate reductase cytochrome b subunit